MSILIDQNTRLVIQGITGRDGSFHAGKMKTYGTNVVAGVSPGKGGLKVDGIPVFNTVYEAVEKENADTSVIFVPARFAKDALLEAADAGIKLIICITEGIPTLDVISALSYIQKKGAVLIGPNCPGLVSPGKSLAGIMPSQIFKPGKTGIISRSGTLTYEIVYTLTSKNIGQSTAVGIGGDPIVGSYYQDLLEMFEKDPETDSIVLIGEIGGDAEERTAEYIKQHINKRVVAFIAGQTAPPDKQMGHAGAIISSGSGTAMEKIIAFEQAGIPVAKLPSEIPTLLINQ
jgi:succinyl-CoA synthetase alpha subunit